jgi:hypothetical protein
MATTPPTFASPRPGTPATATRSAARAADSTGGFTFVVCALKALLEHDVVLTVVLDAHPEGLQL